MADALRLLSEDASEWDKVADAANLRDALLLLTEDASEWDKVRSKRNLHAVQQAKLPTIACRIQNGTVDDARWLALGANQAHGLRRTNADKRRAVEEALRMRPQMSDRAIAEHCGVSDRMVNGVRAETRPASANLSQMETRTVTRGGSTYSIDTSNIGKPRTTDPQPQRDDIPGPLPGMESFAWLAQVRTVRTCPIRTG